MKRRSGSPKKIELTPHDCGVASSFNLWWLGLCSHDRDDSIPLHEGGALLVG